MSQSLFYIKYYVSSPVTGQHPTRQGSPSHKGRLKVDATCSDAGMRYPADLDLVHDDVEIADRVINRLCEINKRPLPKTHL